MTRLAQERRHLAGAQRPDGHPGPQRLHLDLTFKDNTVLTFDSAGKLTSEADANGNTVTYSWTGSNVTTITAANGQHIGLSYTEQQAHLGDLLPRTAAIAQGRLHHRLTLDGDLLLQPDKRQLTHVVKYVYTSSRLTEMDALDYPTSGTTATETFTFDTASPLQPADRRSSPTTQRPRPSPTTTPSTARGPATTTPRPDQLRLVHPSDCQPLGCLQDDRPHADTEVTHQVFTWNTHTGTEISHTNPKAE